MSVSANRSDLSHHCSCMKVSEIFTYITKKSFLVIHSVSLLSTVCICVHGVFAVFFPSIEEVFAVCETF